MMNMEGEAQSKKIIFSILRQWKYSSTFQSPGKQFLLDLLLLLYINMKRPAIKENDENGAWNKNNNKVKEDEEANSNCVAVHVAEASRNFWLKSIMEEFLYIFLYCWWIFWITNGMWSSSWTGFLRFEEKIKHKLSKFYSWEKFSNKFLIQLKVSTSKLFKFVLIVIFKSTRIMTQGGKALFSSPANINCRKIVNMILFCWK